VSLGVERGDGEYPSGAVKKYGACIVRFDRVRWLLVVRGGAWGRGRPERWTDAGLQEGEGRDACRPIDVVALGRAHGSRKGWWVGGALQIPRKKW